MIKNIFYNPVHKEVIILLLLFWFKIYSKCDFLSSKIYSICLTQLKADWLIDTYQWLFENLQEVFKVRDTTPLSSC